MKKTATFIAVFALFIFSLSAYAADFHVNGSTGTDNGDCGAVSTPCKTIEQGVTNAGTGSNVVRIAVGSYSEHVLIDYSIGSLTLQGGWNTDFSDQNCNPNLTVWGPGNGSSAMRVDARSTESITVSVSCLTFKGSDDTHHIGIDIYAVSGGALALDMDRSIIDGFAGSGMNSQSASEGTADVTIHKSIFKNAYQRAAASQTGGGIRVAAYTGAKQTITLENCLFSNNEAVQGAAINLNANGSGSTAHLSLTNVTLANNLSIGPDFGAGISIASANSAEAEINITNSIVWGNTLEGTASDISLIRIPFGTSTVNARYSIIGEISNSPFNPGLYNDNGHNLNIDPRLNSTYHLNADSPAIDTALCGNYSPPFYLRVAPYDDIDGDQRPGVLEVAGCDIGADEYIDDSLCFPVISANNKIAVIL